MDRRRGRTAGLGSGLTADLFPVTLVAEPRSIELEGRAVGYVLRRSVRRRSVGFVVDESGLTVHVPWRAPQPQIDAAIQAGSRWILSKLAEWTARPAVPRRRWESGETLYYLGHSLRLDVIEDTVAVLVSVAEPGRLEVRTPSPVTPDRVRELILRWYRRHALRHFAERVAHFSDRLGVARPRLSLSDATTRWGSCNSKGNVRLNWRLMQAGEHIVDYVVAHEIAHLVHLNHSSRFWRAVERLYPDYEAARSELAASTHHLMCLG